MIITITDPDGLETFWMRPYFPLYVNIDRRRFPDGDTLRRELEADELYGVQVEPFLLKRRYASTRRV